ncbi:hypothetical protein ABPG75_004074 [Micractinium tetrahymenae]
MVQGWAAAQRAAHMLWHQSICVPTDQQHRHVGPVQSAWPSPNRLPATNLPPAALRDYGGITRFQGRATTVRCAEGNPGVRAALNEEGAGRVLVVDASGNLRCAIIGDLLSELAEKRGWAGIIINGCVRDTEEIKQFAVGIKALAPHPLKPGKRDGGLRDVPVVVGGTIVCPGDWIYADADGVLVSKGELRVPDNAPKGKIPLTIPGATKSSNGSANSAANGTANGAANGSSSAAACLKASSRSSLLSKLTEGAATPAVPAVPAAAEEPEPRPASFSAPDGLASGCSHDNDRI